MIFNTAFDMSSVRVLHTLPASGTALADGGHYRISTALTDYNFVGPSIGWAHGKFSTGASPSISFSGNFLGAAPSIEAGKTYEFDVLYETWVVQEVVSE